MFHTTAITRGLSFARIIGGLSKSLQIANQIIPLYQKARPAIANARNMIGVLKEITKSSSASPSSKTLQMESVEIGRPKEKQTTAPTFFL